ncbi:MAG: hypothetical protein ACLRY7_13220 [Hominenteromicrobium sp.]|uniref:hypothetical protein n=1 Tax=Hominenteromicrobium sp. TaxID=3073581 RepID=UPI0039A1A842
MEARAHRQGENCRRHAFCRVRACAESGLIVMDEEQESTYKSESTPRYHARDIAKFRVNYNRAYCLLCSATPSVESYYMAQSGKYRYHALHHRYGDAVVPTVQLVDMNNEDLSTAASR